MCYFREQKYQRHSARILAPFCCDSFSSAFSLVSFMGICWQSAVKKAQATLVVPIKGKERSKVMEEEGGGKKLFFNCLVNSLLFSLIGPT